MTSTRAADSLRRLDDRPIDHTAESIVACVVLRDEVDRIPALLDHHRRLGVDRFLIVDNGSDDGSVELLLDQPDVHLWSSSMSFREANYGAAWFEAILRAHAPTNWVVIIDADELLWFDECESRPLADLCAELDGDGHRAMSGVLLDLYPQGPLAEARPRADRSPLEESRWFDRRWCHGVAARSGPNQDQIGVFGGVRRRLFGGDGWDYCLSKVPLLKFGPEASLVGGQHWTSLPLAPAWAAVLHLKLDARLVDLAWVELARGERATHDQEYLAYAEQLALHPQLSAYDPAESVEFTGSASLREFGVIGPITDPDEARTRVGALMAQAEVRLGAGDRQRAIALLDRAAEIQPTGVGPLLRLAALHRTDGDPDAAATAFAAAIARRPGDLEILTIAAEDPQAEPDWWREVEPALHAADLDLPIIADLSARFTVTPEFGSDRPVLTEPWIGVCHAAIIGPADTTHPAPAPFARRSLEALWASPEFQRSLPQCRTLVTFTEVVARWLRDRTDTPVVVLPHPLRSAPTFDLDSFLGASPRTVVQPGLLHTDLNAICDLPVGGEDRSIRKVRCVAAGKEQLATAIARVQRRASRARVDVDALRATTDLGGVETAEIDAFLTSSIVLAAVDTADADPMLLACMASATPILVPPLPAVIELLGADYPLLFDSLDQAARLVHDDAAIAAAHRRLLERRPRHSVQSFVESFLAVVADAAAAPALEVGR